jgi:hypothetical protein
MSGGVNTDAELSDDNQKYAAKTFLTDTELIVPSGKTAPVCYDQMNIKVVTGMIQEILTELSLTISRHNVYPERFIFTDTVYAVYCTIQLSTGDHVQIKPSYGYDAGKPGWQDCNAHLECRHLWENVKNIQNVRNFFTKLKERYVRKQKKKEIEDVVTEIAAGSGIESVIEKILSQASTTVLSDTTLLLSDSNREFDPPDIIETCITVIARRTMNNFGKKGSSSGSKRLMDFDP